MKKPFEEWHRKKARIDAFARRPFFHEREIWFAHLGVNVGFEQDGKGGDFLRPIIILRTFKNDTFWAVPLTKAVNDKKRLSPFYFCFSFIPGVESAAILSQIRLLDARRLARKIGHVPMQVQAPLNKKLRELIP